MAWRRAVCRADGVADLGLLRILLDLLDRLLFGREFALGDQVLQPFLLADELLERHCAGVAGARAGKPNALAFKPRVHPSLVELVDIKACGGDAEAHDEAGDVL